MIVLYLIDNIIDYNIIIFIKMIIFKTLVSNIYHYLYSGIFVAGTYHIKKSIIVSDLQYFVWTLFSIYYLNYK